jgi:ketosteroid isomerase-like protein
MSLLEPPPVQQHDPAADEAVLRKLVADKDTAAEQFDFDRIVSMYEPDASLFCLMPPYRGDVAGMRQVMESCRVHMPEGFTSEHREVEVTVGGDLAVVQAVHKLTASQPDHPMNQSWQRETTCLRRHADDWKVFHAHTSYPWDCMSGEAAYFKDADLLGPSPEPTPHIAASGNVPDEGSIHDLLADWNDAVEQQDLDRLMAMYDPTLSHYDLMPPYRLDGREQLRNAWAEAYPHFPAGFTSHHKEVHVTLGDALAVVDCLHGLRVPEPDHPMNASWMRATVALRWDGEAWKIFHEHVSMPWDWQAGKATNITDADLLGTPE